MSVEFINGDAFEEIENIDTPVDAVVCDPPYGLDIFDCDWDDFDSKEYQEWCESWAEKCFDVLKAGGHLLAFSGNRTHHRAFAGIEDAGFEIRDTLTWHFAEGMPKSQDIGDVIERYSDKDGDMWNGWGYNLKPTTEFIVLARKPIDEDSAYRNVLEFGTGGLNIDACRVPAGEELAEKTPNKRESGYFGIADAESDVETPDGRYPPNLILGEEITELFDEVAGESSDTKSKRDHDGDESRDSDFINGDRNPANSYGDEGGRSRYFKKVPRFNYESKATDDDRTHDGNIVNDHPTTKPTSLMRWLVKLVTREGQTILDPFAGSGTTGIACYQTDRAFVGIEKKKKYYDIAQKRLQCIQENSEG